jgi:hypothetical protein
MKTTKHKTQAAAPFSSLYEFDRVRDAIVILSTRKRQRAPIEMESKARENDNIG